MEGEEQSVMQSPVSMATAKSALFVSYANCAGDDGKDADMADGIGKTAAQRGAIGTCKP